MNSTQLLLNHTPRFNCILTKPYEGHALLGWLLDLTTFQIFHKLFHMFNCYVLCLKSALVKTKLVTKMIKSFQPHLDLGRPPPPIKLWSVPLKPQTSNRLQQHSSAWRIILKPLGAARLQWKDEVIFCLSHLRLELFLCWQCAKALDTQTSSQTTLPWKVNAWHALSRGAKPTHCFLWHAGEVNAADPSWCWGRVTCQQCMTDTHCSGCEQHCLAMSSILPPASRCAADIWPSSASCPKWGLWGHLHSKGRWLCSPACATFTDISTVQVRGLHPWPCQKVWAGDADVPRHPEVAGEKSPFLPASVLAPARQ